MNTHTATSTNLYRHVAIDTHNTVTYTAHDTKAPLEKDSSIVTEASTQHIPNTFRHRSIRYIPIASIPNTGNHTLAHAFVM